MLISSNTEDAPSVRGDVAVAFQFVETALRRATSVPLR